jgi:hypothetical protein
VQQNVETLERAATEGEVLALAFRRGCSTLYYMKTAAVTIRLDPSLEELLDRIAPYYGNLREYVLGGLAVFDERNVEGRYGAIHRALELCAPHEQPVFRVVDDLTREASLRPVKAGAVLFNLRAKRIIQLQNSYWEINRTGRGRIFDGTRMTADVFSYRLPKEWALVP